MSRFIIVGVFLVGLIGCASRTTPAPIENMTNIPGYIKPVDTPTTVATNEQQPKQEEAQMGALAKPSESPVVNTQQQTVQAEDKPVKSVASGGELVVGTGNEWLVPTSGTAQSFSKATKGTDIYGKSGQKVIASNSGKVVYSGNGLKGYGNLIIIKHSDGYLTAYAHNKTNLVKEGATVSRGDKIAEMGEDDGQALLHFEVRKNGKPIDPIKFITGN